MEEIAYFRAFLIRKFDVFVRYRRLKFKFLLIYCQTIWFFKILFRTFNQYFSTQWVTFYYIELEVLSSCSKVLQNITFSIKPKHLPFLVQRVCTDSINKLTTLWKTWMLLILPDPQWSTTLQNNLVKSKMIWNNQPIVIQQKFTKKHRNPQKL